MTTFQILKKLWNKYQTNHLQAQEMDSSQDGVVKATHVKSVFPFIVG